MLKKASWLISSGNTSSVVDYAIEANRQQLSVKRELDEAKAHLRKVARNTSKRGAVTLNGTLGVATVLLPEDMPQVSAEGLKELEERLSPDTFGRLFIKQTTLTPVRELPSLLATLSGAERELVEQHVTVKPSTPKVYLTY